MVQQTLDDLFDQSVSYPPSEGIPLTAERLAMDYWDSPLGTVVSVFDEESVCWLSFMDGEPEAARTFIQRRFSADVEVRRCSGHDVLQRELDEYFRGEREVFSVARAMRGTAFQKEVWEALVAIPYGQTMSYSDLALRVGVKNGQRAVGKANGDNPVSILVPCHRVVRSDGDLCGYAGGLWRKQRLLAIESGQAGLF